MLKLWCVETSENMPFTYEQLPRSKLVKLVRRALLPSPMPGQGWYDGLQVYETSSLGCCRAREAVMINDSRIGFIQEKDDAMVTVRFDEEKYV